MTTKEKEASAIDYLVKAKATLSAHTQANQIKLGLVRYILDMAGVEDKDVRQTTAESFLEMPSWFGASANAMQKCPDYAKGSREMPELPKGSV